MRPPATAPTTDQHALVSTAWLADHLRDPRVRVVEVDVSPAAYDAGHIDGAVLWDIYRDLKDEDHEPRPTAALERLLRRSGIEEGSTVVVYGYAPALGCWLLEHLGHHDVRILDVPRDTWRDEGRPWTQQVPQHEETAYRVTTQDGALRALLPAVSDAVGRADHTILDVRSDLEFVGERFWPSGGIPHGARAGRIPSAVHLPIDVFVTPDGTFRSADEVRRGLADHGVREDATITTYCTVGARAATVWFALTHVLGLDDVRVYDGSWVQWGRTPGTPVEQG